MGRQQGFSRFKDPIRVPWIENGVPRFRENFHWIPKLRKNLVLTIREIGSLHVHTGYLKFSSNKNLVETHGKVMKGQKMGHAEAIQTELCNVNLTTTCLCVSLAKAHTTQKARRVKMTNMNLPWAAIYFIFCSLKEILERQLIPHPKTGCCNIFCNCESSHVPNALRRPAAVEAVACRGLMRPGATVGWYAFFKILVLKHWRTVAIVTGYILLWRHKMTSYSRMQTNFLSSLLTQHVDYAARTVLTRCCT